MIKENFCQWKNSYNQLPDTIKKIVHRDAPLETKTLRGDNNALLWHYVFTVNDIFLYAYINIVKSKQKT